MSDSYKLESVNGIQYPIAMSTVNNILYFYFPGLFSSVVFSVVPLHKRLLSCCNK